MQQLKNKVFLTLLSLITAIQPCFALSASPEMLFVAKNFLLVMGAVALSGILIYIGLSIYNKVFHNPKVNEKTTYDENSLEPAKNLDNAVSNFLNRTDM